MKINLPLNLAHYPIRPEHIKADTLFCLAEKIVLLCQRQGGWYPFRVQELKGVTTYQLRQLRGLIQIHDRFYISHEFVLNMLVFAPAVDVKQQKHLLLQARQKANGWVVEQTWERLPELILLGAWLCTGLVNSYLIEPASLADALKEVLFWPISPYNLLSLAVWLSVSWGGITWLSRQTKVVCLTPAFSWYQKGPLHPLEKTIQTRR